MNTRKGIRVLFLACLLMLGCLWAKPETVFAAEGDVILEGTHAGGCNYAIVESANGYTITFTANGSDTTVPENACKMWSDYATKITKIVVDDDITSFGKFCFSGMTALEEVEFGENSQLQTVFNKAFENCVNLKEIHFGDNLTRVYTNAFLCCEQLTVIDFGRGSSTGVTFNDTVTKFCSNLRTLVLPEVIQKIGNNSFYQIHQLKDIYWYGSDMQALAELFTSTSQVDGVVERTLDVDYLAEWGINWHIWDEAGGQFTEVESMGMMSAGDTVTAYRDYALDEVPLLLYGNGANSRMADYARGADAPWSDSAAGKIPGVTTVILMENVTYIGKNAFADCAGLENVIYYGTEEQWDQLEIESGNEALANASVEFRLNGFAGESVTYSLVSEDGGVTYSLILGGKDAMDDFAVYHQPWWHVRHFITSVKFAEGNEVTSIGAYALDKLRYATEIQIGDYVESVSTYTLRGCISLTEITFPEGFTSIGNGAFSGVTSLISVNLPSTLSTVDLKAFEYCTGIKNVTFNGYEYQWNNIAIDNSQNKNDRLLKADLTFKEAPDVTVYGDAAASKHVEQLQYLYERGLVTAAYSDRFGTELLLTEEEVLTVLYIWAGADSRYPDGALQWAKENGLLEGEPGVLTANKLQTLLDTVTLYNGYEENTYKLEPGNVTLTRGEGLAVLCEYLQYKEKGITQLSVANRIDTIEAQLKAVMEAGGDGNLYVIAPNLYVPNLGKKVGDCTLIIFPDGKTMMIDAGLGMGNAAEDPGNTSNALRPFLNNIGVTSLDYFVITHGHGDHYGGAKDVVKYIYQKGGTIGEYWYCGAYKRAVADLTALLADKGVSMTEMYIESDSPDNIIKINVGGTEVAVFGPNKEDLALAPEDGSGSDKDENNTSICLKITFGESAFIACGDLYTSKEDKLVQAYGDWLRADVVKGNHHGNYTSNGEAWINTVQPKIFIAEIDGTGNDGVAQRVSRYGTYFTTGFDGAMMVKMDGTGNCEMITQYDGVLRKQNTEAIDLLTLGENMDLAGEQQEEQPGDVETNQPGTQPEDVQGGDDTEALPPQNNGGSMAIILIFAVAVVLILQKRLRK